MSLRPLLVLCCLLALPVAAQPPEEGMAIGKVALPKQDAVDLSAPQLAVRSFVAAFNRFDLAAASQCVQDGKPEAAEALKAVVEQWRKTGGQILIGDSKARLLGEMAIVNLPVQMKMTAAPNQPQEQPAQSERVLLRRSENLWKIVGNPNMRPARGKGVTVPDAPPGLEPGNGFLTMMATFLGNPLDLNQARHDAQRAACQNNLKQLALAAFQLAQDKNDKLDFALVPGVAPAPATLKADWQKAFFAYAKSESVFVCPTINAKAIEETQKDPKLKNQAQNLGARAILPAEAYESYAFNPALEGVKLGEIAEPSATVLLYEGKDGNLEFRHGGKTVVAFADGHVETLSPDDVKKLIWNPKGIK